MGLRSIIASTSELLISVYPCVWKGDGGREEFLHVHMCVYVSAYRRVCVVASVQIYTCRGVYVCVCGCVFVCVCLCVSMCVCVWPCVFVGA